jgi:hypothetical protein
MSHLLASGRDFKIHISMEAHTDIKNISEVVIIRFCYCHSYIHAVYSAPCFYTMALLLRYQYIS